MEYSIEQIINSQQSEKLLAFLEALLAEFAVTHEQLLAKLAYAIKRNKALECSRQRVRNELSAILKNSETVTDAGEYGALLKLRDEKTLRHERECEKYSGVAIVKREFLIECLERGIDEAIKAVLLIKKLAKKPPLP